MSSKTQMHGSGESYRGIVPVRPPHEGLGGPQEVAEGRPWTKENEGQSHSCRTPSRGSEPSGLDLVRQTSVATIRGKNRVREQRQHGSVRGVSGNRHPYRDQRRTSGRCEARTEVRACKLVKGFGRVGHRRVTLSHVSCTPSSNRTCGFPASGSPTIFSRRHAPQARQMAHPSHHLVQPTPFIQEPIVPALPSGPPTALMLASEP